MRARLARALATIGGLGDLWPAPGTTVGSALGVTLFALLARLPGVPPRPLAGLGLLLLLPLAVWACGAEAARRGTVDPGPVVLDEVVGQWLALAVVVMWHPQPPGWRDLALSFVLFRAFDVVKPWPISALERLPGGWGVVADDLGAGLAAAALHLLLVVTLWR